MLTLESLKRCKICSKLIIRTPEQHERRYSGVFTVNFEHTSNFFLELITSTLSMYLLTGQPLSIITHFKQDEGSKIIKFWWLLYLLFLVKVQNFVLGSRLNLLLLRSGYLPAQS